MSAAVALAIGACAAALGLEILPPPAVLLAAVSVGLLGRATAGLGSDRRRPPIRWWPLALGGALIALRALALPTAATTGPLPTGEGPWTGTVVSVGSAHGATRPAVVALDAPPGLVIAATLPWYPAVGADDRVSLSGRIEPPPPDDFGRYLARIGAAGSVRADAVEVLPPPPGLGRWLEDQRRSAATGLERALPEPEAGLSAGILIGLRDRVDRQLAADFTTAGVSHIVAISGWNIAIVATSIGALAGGLGRRRRTVLTSVAIVAYVAFVGPSPSVVRAAAMAGLVLLARELGRPSRATAALGWAVAGLLLVDPGWIDDAGFRLSVLATAGLMAWGTGLTRRIAGAEPGRLRAWLAESLGVSLAAQAATLPVILLEFGRLSLVSPFVNLAVVPLVAPAMAAGALALGAGLVAGLGLPVIATLGGLPAWVLLGAIVGGVRIGAGMPLASVTLESPWDLVAAVASAVAIVGGATRGPQLAAWIGERLRGGPARPVSRAAPGPTTRSRRGAPGPQRASRWAAAALAGATLALAIAVVERPPGVTTVTVLDVGQGDGILVESADGQRLLVDGGPDPTGLVRTLDERLPPWDRRIDILVLTHPHEDHVAGLAMLLDRYRVRRVYEPGMIGPGPGYRAWTEALARRSVTHGTLATGDRFELADIAFRVLWPDPGRVPLHPADGGTAINNVSIVLLGTVGAHRFLLAGDVEQDVDPELLARGLPRVDLLKVAHHGSKTASTEPFLEAVHPRVAIVSAGLGNPYGHPAPATIGRLEAITKQTYRTDRDGSVQVRFEGDLLRVRTSGPSRAAVAEPTTAPPARPALATGSSGLSARPALDCGIVRATAPATAATTRDPLPVVGESPLGSPLRRIPTTAAGAGAWHLDRIPARDGVASGLSYHRADDRTSPSRSDGAEPERLRQRAPRLLLGRRRLRPRGRRRGVPARRIALPRRRAGALATGRGGGRDGPHDR